MSSFKILRKIADKVDMVRSSYLILIMSLFLGGCGGQIEDFVNSGALTPKELITEKPPTNSSIASDKMMSISAGATTFSNTQVKGHMRLAPHKQLHAGTAVDATMSINSHRVQ